MNQYQRANTDTHRNVHVYCSSTFTADAPYTPKNSKACMLVESQINTLCHSPGSWWGHLCLCMFPLLSTWLCCAPNMSAIWNQTPMDQASCLPITPLHLQSHCGCWGLYPRDNTHVLYINTFFFILFIRKNCKVSIFFPKINSSKWFVDFFVFIYCRKNMRHQKLFAARKKMHTCPKYNAYFLKIKLEL